jgi:hypothetical protein
VNRHSQTCDKQLLLRVTISTELADFTRFCPSIASDRLRRSVRAGPCHLVPEAAGLTRCSILAQCLPGGSQGIVGGKASRSRVFAAELATKALVHRFSGTRAGALRGRVRGDHSSAENFAGLGQLPGTPCGVADGIRWQLLCLGRRKTR